MSRFPSGRRRRVLVVTAVVAVLAAGLLVGATMVNTARQTPVNSGDPVIAAAGDVACDPGSRSFRNGEGTKTACRQMAVSDLLLDPGITNVLALGDLQYYCASKEAFQDSYDLSWGRVKDRTLPVVGNHEYIDKNDDATKTDRTGCDAANEGAAGYFDYFGAAAGDPSQGWYSHDVGQWHLVALNTNCRQAGGCNAGSPQFEWLRADLAAHPAECTLAFWHHPRFSSGDHGSDSDYTQLWEQIYRAGADVVVNGHEHIYERFAPQTPDGASDGRHGVRQFTVGTGGANHTELSTVAPNSEVRETATFGVLRLTLHPSSYTWEFVPERGGTFTDRGDEECHGPPR